MSSFHGRTRPDAPRIPQDLATKGYVDGNALIQYSLGNTFQTDFNKNVFNYLVGMNAANPGGNEGTRRFLMAITATVLKSAMRVRAVTLDEDMTVTLRQDGAPIVPSYVFTVGGNGDFFIDDIHPILLDESWATWNYNTTLATVGTLVITSNSLICEHNPV